MSIVQMPEAKRLPIELGDWAHDTVTSFHGTVTAIVFIINGRVDVELTSKADGNGHSVNKWVPIETVQKGVEKDGRTK